MGAEVSVHLILYPRPHMMAPLDRFVLNIISRALSALTSAADASAWRTPMCWAPCPGQMIVPPQRTLRRQKEAWPTPSPRQPLRPSVQVLPAPRSHLEGPTVLNST